MTRATHDFKVGDRVCWRSGANGSTLEKEGEVVYVVGPIRRFGRTLQYMHVSRLDVMHSLGNVEVRFDGILQEGDVLVLVKRVSKKTGKTLKPYLYKPRIHHLCQLGRYWRTAGWKGYMEV